MNIIRPSWLVALALGLIVSACARPSPVSLSTAAPGVPVSFSLPSAALGEDRRVNVHLPRSYHARAGATARYPVLYMPDGGVDEDFPHVIATVDSLTRLGLIREVIVVGIPNTQRRRDLTGPTRFARDSAIAPKVGGSAAFRAFLRDELLPAVDARFRTTEERGIMGESLAGLFVLETMLMEPALFRHYVAFDPSLWWNGRALIDTARVRLAAPREKPVILLLGSSGEREIAEDMELFGKQLQAANAKYLVWGFEHHPELTHATIYRALKPSALHAIFVK